MRWERSVASVRGGKLQEILLKYLTIERTKREEESDDENSTGFSQNRTQWLSETGRIFHSFEICFINHFQNFATYTVYKNIESAP
jgi:hypothetical protein